MESTNTFKELNAEFSKYRNQDNRISEINAQKASWKFGIYPSTSQIFEVHDCSTEDNCLHDLEFHEFSLLIATIKNEIDLSNGEAKFKILRRSNNTKPRWDVFLGGACNPTTWRFDVAIPFLKERHITFYNPQVSQWDPNLIEIEERAKQTCKVQFFVLDIYKTRGIASLVEAAYLSGQGRNLVLVVPKERPKTINDIFEIKELDEIEFQSINRSYLFIADLVQRQGIPLFTNVTDALKATRISLISKCMVQDLTDIDKVIPVKHAFVNVSATVRSLKKVFDEFDRSRSGLIQLSDVYEGLFILFDCDVTPMSTKKETFTFADFCLEYSILLLESIRLHRSNPRSQSVIFSCPRSTSLDVISSIERVNTLKSVINVRGKVFTQPEVQNHVFQEKKEIQSKKKFSCCCWNRKMTTCVTWLMKWPFSKISALPTTIPDLPLSPVSERLVPHLLVGEEKYDIFLGGTCGNSDWREKIAIPLLKAAGCTYYDPKVSSSTWSRRLLPIEAQAREHSKILVYVITGECTSTAALVEAAHFIGQQRKLVLHVQFLASMSSPPLTHRNQFLQSSISFPLSSTTTDGSRKSPFFQLYAGESTTSDYQSASITDPSASRSQFSLPPMSGKLSTSDSGHLHSIDDLVQDLSMSFNNISRINPLPPVACKDHNRGRNYLLDVATRAKVTIVPTIDETIRQAIKLCQRDSLIHTNFH